MQQTSAATIATGEDQAIQQGGGAIRRGRFDALCERVRRLIQTRWGYALSLFVLFALGVTPALAVLVLNGKSMFWGYDGLLQQYVWFVYTGQWLRELLSNIFVEHTFTIPMWSMDAGYGADVLQTVSYAAINPFYAVSVFVPEQYAEYAFEAAIVAQIYVAGLAFSLWCLHRDAPRAHMLVGAVVYMFAGSMVNAFVQPGFLFAAWAFPLLLWATDRVFERRGWLAYVLILAFCFAYSYYDAYMMAILLVLYCVLEFVVRFDRERGRVGRVRRLVKWVLVFVGLTALAFLLACVLLLPQVMALSGASRLDLERTGRIAWSLRMYLNFIMGFGTSFAPIGSDAYTGFCVLAPLATLCLVFSRPRNKGLIVAFVVLTVMMLVPAFGYVMNAFVYPTDRWSWAYSMCVAYVVVWCLPQMVAASRRTRVVSVVLVGAFCLAMLAMHAPKRVLVQLPLMVAAVVVIVLAGRGKLGRRAGTALLGGCALVSSAVLFALYPALHLGDQVASGDTWRVHSMNSYAALVSQVEDYDDTYRLDRVGRTAIDHHNSGLITGIMVPDWYNSVYSPSIDEFVTSLGLPDDEGANNRYGALNARSMLDALLGVKYFYAKDVEVPLMPAQFADSSALASGVDVFGAPYSLYETDQVAPLAFSPSCYITRSEYEALDTVDRQKALLQAVVIEDDDAAAVEAAGLAHAEGLELDSEEIPYEVVATEGLTIDGTHIDVRCEGASMTLAYDNDADAETYLDVQGLTFKGALYRELMDEGTYEGLSLLGKAKLLVKDAYDWRLTRSEMRVNSQGTTTSAYLINDADEMYGGKENFTIKLGRTEDGRTTVTVWFAGMGTYDFDSLRLVRQPLDDLDGEVAQMQAAGARDIAIEDNGISYTSTSEEGGLLFVSTTYSNGWSATVDGEPAEVLKADVGFVAVAVPAGEHEVRLSYETPYLRAGAALSLVGAAGTAAAGVTSAALRRRRAA